MSDPAKIRELRKLREEAASDLEQARDPENAGRIWEKVAPRALTEKEQAEVQRLEKELACIDALIDKELGGDDSAGTVKGESAAGVEPITWLKSATDHGEEFQRFFAEG